MRNENTISMGACAPDWRSLGALKHRLMDRRGPTDVLPRML